ncbi:MAG: anti-sigma factor [Desulfococcaceae bacterium]
MNTCEKYEETLWLDVYGELPREKSAELKKHTETCAVCRGKSGQLHTLIRAVRESSPVPALSAWESENLRLTVMSSLKKENRGWHGFPAFFRIRFVPALFTACLLLFFTGWFGLREWQESAQVHTAKMLKAEEMQIIKNYELISNLELLEDMDDVEKLVRTVDQKKYGEFSQKQFLLVRKAEGNEKNV